MVDVRIGSGLRSVLVLVLFWWRGVA